MEAPYNFFDIGIRLCLVCVSAYISARILASVLDPDSAQKKKAKETAEVLMKKLGLKGKLLNLNEHEMLMASQLVSTAEIDKSWEDVGGQEELIQEIRKTLILPLRLRSRPGCSLLTPPKGILLYGPPGCGKTLIAKALAKSTGARFMNLQISTLTDKWYGESQKLTAALFSVAKKLQPVIIFIDEIDSFLRVRSSWDHECTAMIKAQFMSFWDGFTSDPKADVIIIGATNRPNDVDAAILRRMPARFQIPLPNAVQRQRILEVILRQEQLEETIDLADVAAEADEFSGSDLKEVCRLAAINRMQDLIIDEETIGDDPLPLRLVDLLEGVHKMKRTKVLDKWATANSATFP